MIPPTPSGSAHGSGCSDKPEAQTKINDTSYPKMHVLRMTSHECDKYQKLMISLAKVQISKFLNVGHFKLKNCSIPAKILTMLSLNGQLSLDKLIINQRSLYIPPNSAF